MSKFRFGAIVLLLCVVSSFINPSTVTAATVPSMDEFIVSQPIEGTVVFEGKTSNWNPAELRVEITGVVETMGSVGQDGSWWISILVDPNVSGEVGATAVTITGIRSNTLYDYLI